MPSTKDQIILLADELIRSRGYNAFSYTDISKPLGIKNAAVHYHFATKAKLALAVVQFHLVSIERFKEKSEPKPPLQRIKLFLNFYASIQMSGKICLVGAFATDWNSLPNEVHDAMLTFKTSLITWLANTLHEGKESGSLTFNESPETEALSILTNIFAAAQLARIQGNEDFHLIKESILHRITK